MEKTFVFKGSKRDKENFNVEGCDITWFPDGTFQVYYPTGQKLADLKTMNGVGKEKPNKKINGKDHVVHSSE